MNTFAAFATKEKILGERSAIDQATFVLASWLLREGFIPPGDLRLGVEAAILAYDGATAGQVLTPSMVSEQIGQ